MRGVGLERPRAVVAVRERRDARPPRGLVARPLARRRGACGGRPKRTEPVRSLDGRATGPRVFDARNARFGQGAFRAAPPRGATRISRGRPNARRGGRRRSRGRADGRAGPRRSRRGAAATARRDRCPRRRNARRVPLSEPRQHQGRRTSRTRDYSGQGSAATARRDRCLRRRNARRYPLPEAASENRDGEASRLGARAGDRDREPVAKEPHDEAVDGRARDDRPDALAGLQDQLAAPARGAFPKSQRETRGRVEGGPPRVPASLDLRGVVCIVVGRRRRRGRFRRASRSEFARRTASRALVPRSTRRDAARFEDARAPRRRG